jgi:hypothetical protein
VTLAQELFAVCIRKLVEEGFGAVEREMTHIVSSVKYSKPFFIFLLAIFYLFLYDLSNGNLSSSDYIMSNYKLI